MNSEFMKLGKNDLFKGAVTAVFAAALTTLYGVVSQSGFDVFSADWGSILNEAIRNSFTAFLAYLSKNLLTSEDGAFLGVN